MLEWFGASVFHCFDGGSKKGKAGGAGRAPPAGRRQATMTAEFPIHGADFKSHISYLHFGAVRSREVHTLVLYYVEGVQVWNSWRMQQVGLWRITQGFGVQVEFKFVQVSRFTRIEPQKREGNTGTKIGNRHGKAGDA